MLRKKYRKKKKGLTLIETCIGGLIFCVVFAVLCDFIIVSHRYLSLTDTTKEIARIISIQGGSLENKPASFQSNYYTIDELCHIVKQQMYTMGFKEGEYQVSIAYTDIYDEDSNSTVTKNASEVIIGPTGENTCGIIKPTEKIDYLSDFSVTVSGLYKWPFLGAVKKTQTTVLSVSMPGLSEWRYKYDGWTEEAGGGI